MDEKELLNGMIEGTNQTSQETATPPELGTPTEVDFASLADSFVSDAPDEVEPKAAAPEAPAPAPASSSPPPEETPARTDSPTGAVASPSSPAQPSSPVETPPPVPQPQVVSQQAEVPAQPAAPMEDPAVRFQRIREEALGKLEGMYALSSDDQAGLMDEGLAKILPKQFAKLHFEVQSGIYTALQEHIPAMLQSVLEQNNRVQEFKNAFYGRWNDLRGKDEEVITKTIAMYRQAFPQVSEKVLIEQAGALAMQHFGLDPIASRRENTQQPPAPPPPAPAPVHMPAGTGAASGPVMQQRNGDDNLFSSLATQWREEQLRSD